MKILKDLPFNTRIFLVLAIVITSFFVIAFGLGQQIYRQLANDPQIQLSQDMAYYLEVNKDWQAVMPKSYVDISKSAVWFVMFFYSEGKVLASNAKLNGQIPEIPQGVLKYAQKNGQNRVTWQPEDGVRVAAVVTGYKGGQVLVGRSLNETEKRVMMLLGRVVLGWIAVMILTFAGTQILLPKRLH